MTSTPRFYREVLSCCADCGRVKPVPGMLEGDYRAMLDALGTDPSAYDVARLLEFGTPAAQPHLPRTPQTPPRWDARLRLMDFDLPAPPPEGE